MKIRSVLFVVCISLLFAAPALADGSLGTADEVAVVIQFAPGRQIVRRIPLSARVETGQEALLASGLEIIVQGDQNNGPICRIGDAGCDYPDESCFCAMPDWWHYHYWVDGAWQISGVGAAGWALSPGMIDGWSWGGTWDMAEIKAEALFDIDALSPSLPQIIASVDGFTVQIPTQGDANGNATVDCVVSDIKGDHTVAIVAQSGGDYVGRLAGPRPGVPWECILIYNDPEGVNGSETWHESGSIAVEQPERLYLPCFHLGG